MFTLSHPERRATAILLAVTMLGLLYLLHPYLVVIAFSFILAVLFRPVYYWVLRRRPGSHNLAAFAAVASAVLLILIPLYLFGQLAALELIDLYQKYRSGTWDISYASATELLPASLIPRLQSLIIEIQNSLGSITGSAVQTVTGLLSNVASFALSLFLTFFLFFFVMRDGSGLRQAFHGISPFSVEREQALVDHVRSAIEGVVRGTVLVALSQGVVASIGFIIFGVPQPLLWGMLTFFAAFVPTVGTSLSLIPAVAYLLLTGQYGMAIGLTIWAVLAVGLIDNLIGPKLIGDRVKVHPAIILLSVLGGVQILGIAGLLFGPILASVVLAVLQIFRQDQADARAAEQV